MFVNDVIDMFEIGENVTRVGIATFSSHVYREFYLNQYYDKEQIKTAVGRIIQRQGYSTNTGRAIWHMRKRMFSTRHGSRPNVAKVGNEIGLLFLLLTSLFLTLSLFQQQQQQQQLEANNSLQLVILHFLYLPWFHIFAPANCHLHSALRLKAIKHLHTNT